MDLKLSQEKIILPLYSDVGPVALASMASGLKMAGHSYENEFRLPFVPNDGLRSTPMLHLLARTDLRPQDVYR